VRRVWAGIPDTFFSVPAHGDYKGYIAGFLTINDEGEYVFNVYKKYAGRFPGTEKEVVCEQ
jgi:hypothetical protein